jgi:hypothetical protein
MISMMVARSRGHAPGHESALEDPIAFIRKFRIKIQAIFESYNYIITSSLR